MQAMIGFITCHNYTQGAASRIIWSTYLRQEKTCLEDRLTQAEKYIDMRGTIGHNMDGLVSTEVRARKWVLLEGRTRSAEHDYFLLF